MKLLLKQQAVELRKQGLSYNQIQKLISVSKGSLSIWLRDIKLTPEQYTKIGQRYWSSELGISINNFYRSSFDFRVRTGKIRYNIPFGTVRVYLHTKNGWKIRAKINKAIDIVYNQYNVP
jgi:hypothetical protein